MKEIILVSNAGPVKALVGSNGLLELDTNIDRNWRSFSPLFRLRLTGTGTCSLDASNGLGVITEDVETYTVNEATNEIKYPYPGDDAVQIRVRVTGSCGVEII